MEQEISGSRKGEGRVEDNQLKSSPSNVRSLEKGGVEGEQLTADMLKKTASDIRRLEEGDQLTADMLKNTPSNIRRLEDEIEQCEGHKKYLAQTRSPSDGGDVRWYFCKVPLLDNELAAAFPRAEIVGKSDYFRFGMRDSLAIEASFLQREEELLSSWWKEFAECSEGPKGRAGSSSASGPSNRVAELCEIEEERVGVPVKGGLYEVDLVRRHCFPVYWNGENRRVLRGHWFAGKGDLDWLPLREDVSEQLEFAYRCQVWHRRTFQPSGLFAARVDLNGATPGLHALFTGEDDTWEAWLNVDASGLSNIISFGGNGIKIRRGYAASQLQKPTQDEIRQQKEEEMDDYCSQVPVRHLVFMVHGIGQRLEKANLVDDVATFRHVTASLAEQHLSPHQRGTQRVLFIPCQWRKDLKLSGESAVEKCTLDGVRGLRVILSATVHDVLYYMSPIYCQDIMDSVSNQLNKLFLKFLKRNPGYDGKVSLYGHSLGSVLSYDILCHQDTLSSPFPMDWIYKEHAKLEKSPPDIVNHSSESVSSSDLKDNVLIANHESVDIVNPTVIDDMKAEPKSALSDDHVEDSDTPPIPSLSDGDDKTKIPSLVEDVLDSCRSMSSEVLNGDLDQVDKAVSQSGQHKTIELLREEVDKLNARIKELESQTREGFAENIKTSTYNSANEAHSKGRIDSQKSYTPVINYTKLEFKVDTFFAVGSPLGVFLALRNVRIGIGKGEDYWEDENINEEMPACRQMFNIFHPFDPVAYRIEPLVCKDYVDKRPVIIPYHRGGKRLHIGFQDFAENVASRSQGVIDRLSFVRVKVLTLCQSRNNNGVEDETSKNAQEEEEERSYGSVMMEKLTGSAEGRIDHVLQDKTFQHQYISAVGAHTNYWRDKDTALFILKHLYRELPDDPETPHEPRNSSSKHESGFEDWLSQEERAAEEDLPLTFGDRVFIKNFSRRANKIMKQ